MLDTGKVYWASNVPQTHRVKVGPVEMVLIFLFASKPSSKPTPLAFSVLFAFTFHLLVKKYN